MISLKQTVVFEQGEVSIMIYENSKVVTIKIEDGEIELSYEEFYQFVSLLEKIKPVK